MRSFLPLALVSDRVLTILPLSSPESSKNKALVTTLSMENKLEYFGINRQNLYNFSAYHCLNIDIKLLIQALSPLSEFVQQKKQQQQMKLKWLFVLILISLSKEVKFSEKILTCSLGMDKQRAFKREPARITVLSLRAVFNNWLIITNKSQVSHTTI